MGAVASIALAAATAGLSLPAAGTFGAGVAVGVGVGVALTAAADVVNDALDSVHDAAEAVMDYLRTAASWAWHKLKAAAVFVKEKVLKLLRRLRGCKEAADAWMVASQQASFRPVVLSRALTMFSATAPGGALALPASVAAPAARAAGRASEMMALLETVEAALGYSIPEGARSCIDGVVTAVGIGLEAIAAAAALDA